MSKSFWSHVDKSKSFWSHVDKCRGLVEVHLNRLQFRLLSIWLQQEFNSWLVQIPMRLTAEFIKFWHVICTTPQPPTLVYLRLSAFFCYNCYRDHPSLRRILCFITWRLPLMSTEQHNDFQLPQFVLLVAKIDRLKFFAVDLFDLSHHLDKEHRKIINIFERIWKNYPNFRHLREK